MRRAIAAAVATLALRATATLAQTPPAPAPPPLTDVITVTATRTETRVADTPASVVVLSRETLNTSAAATTDDALRQVPGFTLFRRSSSAVANPTSQGVSLRGVGPSGASRALVLDDGVPLNDPFGGWVYWGRVPRNAIDRVEVLRGGASDLYGSTAMGGVVQFIRREAAPAFSIDLTGGSFGTATSSLFASMLERGWRASVAGDFYTTNGWTLTRPSQRGSVDVPADSRHTAIDATVGHETAFVRASFYDETRGNGTPLQVNDTSIRQIAAGFDPTFGGGVIALRGYWSDQDYRQTFSAIAADRNSERLTINQRVPSRGGGGSAQFTRSIAARHVLVAGVDVRQVRGESDELRFAVNGSTSNVIAGGTQRSTAAFVEELFSATPALSVTAGLRFDAWRNDGENVQRNSTAWNPRVSVLYRAHDALSLSATAYRAFRAPTLNELYRGFRVGNVVTLPNASLDAETLTGYELGARARHLRVTLFWMDMQDAIANVTLSATPSTITRQRLNVGATRSRGAELDGDWLIGSDWRVSGGWLFADARVTSAELEGRRIPQVPRHAITGQLLHTGASGAGTQGLQLRWTSMQFDDDLNQLPLRDAFVADLFATHPLARGIDATLSIENIFDRDTEVSATPVITLGQPRSIRFGVRYSR